jgi:hypothetical protein
MSDTSSISSDACDRSEVSDELQQEWNEALIQCQRIQELHTTILQRMNHLSERQDIKDMTESISVLYHGKIREFSEMVEEIYQDSVREFDKTGKRQFGPMLLTMLEKCEFK